MCIDYLGTTCIPVVKISTIEKWNLAVTCCVSPLRAREALRQCLPDQLKDSTFAQVLKDDTTTKRWLAQLVKNLQEGQVTDARGIPLAAQWLGLMALVCRMTKRDTLSIFFPLEHGTGAAFSVQDIKEVS